MRKVMVSYLVVVALVFASVITCVGQSGDYSNGYMQGENAANQDVSAGANFAGGFFLGLLYVVIVAVSDQGAPSYYQQQLVSRSPEFQRGFNDGYADEFQRIRTYNALAGSGTAPVAVVILYAILIANMSYYY